MSPGERCGLQAYCGHRAQKIVSGPTIFEEIVKSHCVAHHACLLIISGHRNMKGRNMINVLHLLLACH